MSKKSVDVALCRECGIEGGICPHTEKCRECGGECTTCDKVDKIKWKDIPCIKDRAYYIMVGIEGSWLYEATYPSNQDEKWCEKFVKTFVDDYGDEVNTKYGVCTQNACIQEMVDDGYEDMLSYRLIKMVTT